MFKQGDIISYIDMCRAEGVNLQRGMNYRLRGISSVVLMSVRKGAPYRDRVEDNGATIIYEGHDIPKTADFPDPKKTDQMLQNSGGSLTQNGLFNKAALESKKGIRNPEEVKIYEKIKSGIWVYNGLFHLVDSWPEKDKNRIVYKFKFELIKDIESCDADYSDLRHSRVIPTHVKLEVWERDKGRCVQCGSTDNLHFDHIIPFSKGGTSLRADNIQILCARHNIKKSNKIV